MKNKLKTKLSSFATTIWLLLIYACGLAAATFIEKYYGTRVAKSLVYYSPLFFLLQFLLVVNFVMATVKHHLLKKQRWGLMLTHAAFIVILAGALTTFLWGEEGILHLREGEQSCEYVVQDKQGHIVRTLPFTLELKDFTLRRYPGSASPSSFESEVVIHIDEEMRKACISMNNVLDVEGYRFFQASYDPDEQGTVLSVNFDIAGRSITYGGYCLLMVGFLLSLLGKGSRFRRLGQRLKEMRHAGKVIGLLLLMGWPSLSSATKEQTADLVQAAMTYRVSAEHAAKFGALPILSENGRVMPVNTFSSEVLRKLHKSDTFGQLNSDQFLISLLAMPDMWMRIPLITIPSADLARVFELNQETCAYTEFFNTDGSYKLKDKLEEAYSKMQAARTRFDKDLMKLDEQVNVLSQLLRAQRLNLFPKEDDPELKWYAPGDDLSSFTGKDSMFVSRIMDWYLSEVQEGISSGDWTQANEIVGMIHTYQQAKSKHLNIRPERMQMEMRYNRMQVFRLCKIGYLSLGGLLLLISFVMLFCRNRWLKLAVWVLGIGVLVVFLYHMVGMALRWYIGGYAPWSNSYETMVYVAWATLCGGLLFARRSTLTFALATLFGGIILFVSGLSWMDPKINPLVPVLKSPWLMFHVAVVVTAYGFFGISCLLGITNMCLMSATNVKNRTSLKTRITELSIVNEMTLWVGLAFMTIGTFLGAIWANESWGRYWGWDPKETWALVTVVVYAAVTHLHLVKRWDNTWLFNAASVAAFSTVLMTYFGVNYFLSGMHSYGQNDNMGGIFVYLYAVLAVVLILAIVSRRKYKDFYAKRLEEKIIYKQ